MIVQEGFIVQAQQDIEQLVPLENTETKLHLLHQTNAKHVLLEDMELESPRPHANLVQTDITVWASMAVVHLAPAG